VRGLLAVLNLGALATLLVWPFAAFGALFVFDSPANADLPSTWALFFSMVLYPVPVVAGNVAFWISFRRNREPKVLWAWTATSFVGPLLVLLLLVFGPLS
jgi:hypothetical protein